MPRPVLSIWVPGAPKSQQAKSRARYCAKIKVLAAAQAQHLLRGSKIDIDILFGAKNRSVRADVDNVAKPILDALKRVVYADDKQIRSLRVLAIASDESGRFSGSFYVHQRLMSCNEFLVNVYVGAAVNVPPLAALSATAHRVRRRH